MRSDLPITLMQSAERAAALVDGTSSNSKRVYTIVNSRGNYVLHVSSIYY
jgi:hypothetical protein